MDGEGERCRALDTIKTAAGVCVHALLGVKPAGAASTSPLSLHPD